MSGNDMLSTTPAHLESYLNGLFDAPSKNIESAFQLVLGLITQQSCQIDNLQKAHDEAIARNDELSSNVERAENELIKERIDLAVEFEKLRRDRDNLLTWQEESSAAIGSMQQEIKVG
jgi:hypothetical protein